MIDARWLLGGFLAGVLIVDGVFAWLTYPDLSSHELAGASRPWQAVQSPPVVVTSVENLIAGGFWGDLPQLAAAANEEQNAEQRAAAEAKELRQQVSGIIRDDHHWQVLFNTKDGYRRFSIGDRLPGTQWTLQGIGADSLSLQQPGQPVRLLKLFSDDALVVVEPESPVLPGNHDGEDTSAAERLPPDASSSKQSPESELQAVVVPE